MRICHVITRLIQGGAQENTVYTAQGQAELGHEVTLIHGPELNGESPFFTLPKNVRLVVTPNLVRALSPVKDLKAYEDLKKFFRANSFDIIHTHSSKAGILGRLAAAEAKTKAKIVHTVHGLAFDEFQNAIKNKIYIAAEKKAARVSDAVITVCDAMRDQALQAGVGYKELYHTVRSGSDLTAFQKAPKFREAAREELAIKDDELLLVSVARLFPQKGVEEFLRAARYLPDNVKLLLIGGGPLKMKMEKYAASNLPGRVIFQGEVPPQNIPFLLSAGDLLVHASYREGLARVLVQAMAAGIPAVSSRAGGAAEIIVDGRNGYLFPIGDEKALKARLEAVTGNSELLSKLKEGARETDVSSYSIDAMVRGTMAVYEKLR